MTDNIFSSLPRDLEAEVFSDLLKGRHIRIERIVSKGHASTEWYDQDENEWVMVVEGAGRILFEDGREILLEKGDYLNIPARERHRVTWTDPDNPTIWLAVFYD